MDYFGGERGYGVEKRWTGKSWSTGLLKVLSQLENELFSRSEVNSERIAERARFSAQGQIRYTMTRAVSRSILKI